MSEVRILLFIRRFKTLIRIKHFFKICHISETSPNIYQLTLKWRFVLNLTSTQIEKHYMTLVRYRARNTEALPDLVNRIPELKASPFTYFFSHVLIIFTIFFTYFDIFTFRHYYRLLCFFTKGNAFRIFLH